ncbi:MAG: hypothetical protein U0176_21565 [Bacteroidia bacterium]
MSWDGSAIEIFVNAVSKLRTSISGGLINDTTGFTVGKDLDGSAIDFIKGGIWKLRIWRYPRLATEIKDTMLTHSRAMNQLEWPITRWIRTMAVSLMMLLEVDMAALTTPNTIWRGSILWMAWTSMGMETTSASLR